MKDYKVVDGVSFSQETNVKVIIIAKIENRFFIFFMFFRVGCYKSQI